MAEYLEHGNCEAEFSFENFMYHYNKFKKLLFHLCDFVFP